MFRCAAGSGLQNLKGLSSIENVPLQNVSLPTETSDRVCDAEYVQPSSQKTTSYIDLGDWDQECQYCGCLFWYGERLKGSHYNRRPEYHLCCRGGKMYMYPLFDPPALIQQLLTDSHVMEHIRPYNQMFTMTSFGAKIDNTVNIGRGPYVFKVSGQVYHWIGGLCPEQGDPPRFLQLYIYDTRDEVANRMRNFSSSQRQPLQSQIVDGLMHTLDDVKGLVRLFRNVRDMCHENEVPDFKVRLCNKGGVRGYELPSADMLGGIVFEDGPKSRTYFDVIIHSRGGPPQRISKLHQSYMSLQFPLLLVYGEPGFYPELVLKPRNGRGRGLYDAVSRGDREGIQAGLTIILPRTFTGGPRYMYSHYLDALAICRSLGNPQYFITFTCNVKWPELKRYMSEYPLLTLADRADIVCRVFQHKVNDFLSFLKFERPFGHIIAYLYTIEFQKRGLPHCHTLLWVDNDSQIMSATQIDNYISAEIPNPIDDPEGYHVVTELMLHGPCGAANPNAACTENGVCSKKFPKSYNNKTHFDAKGHTCYQRRQTTVHVIKGDSRLDNSNVVPYNRPDRVLGKVDKNDERDRPSVNHSRAPVDEIQNYVDGRFICPFETCWRIFGFPIHYREPAVHILNVHLPDMQRITFRNRDKLDVVVNLPENKKTTLTEWYVYNNLNTDATHLTYLDLPSEFVWHADSKIWTTRVVRTKKSIGRLTYVYPSLGDLFYFRMLLSHRTGCKSPEDVRTVDGHILPTFRAACHALGLLGDDREWSTALEESSISATSAQLRTLFVQLLIFCSVSDPVLLWERFWPLMQDDIPEKISTVTGIPDFHVNTTDMQDHILYELELILTEYGKSITNFGLRAVCQQLREKLNNRLLMEERNYDRDFLWRETVICVPKLNEEQKQIYHWIIDACHTSRQQLFVYGHGGTGKAFLWKTTINSLRCEGKIVLAVASSGIASLLLPAGRTAHSRFKIPLDLTDESLCHARKHSQLANLLIETTLIIWDEAPMNDKRCFETLDRTLRDLMEQPEILFGGKTVVLGGDFRQTLPVKKGATKAELIHSSVVKSYLWPHFKVVTLTQNMRLLKPDMTVIERQKSEIFADWLLNIGNGEIGVRAEADQDDVYLVTVPEEFCIQPTENALSSLINFIYDRATLDSPTAATYQEKAIVCPTNATADVVNTAILSDVKDDLKTYLSRDEAIPLGNETSETDLLYPTEYLNTFNFSGFPLHELHLKIGVPIMMLRNVNLSGGLCNGIRLIVMSLSSKLIEAQIITGTRVGEKVYIHRIPLTYKDESLIHI